MAFERGAPLERALSLGISPEEANIWYRVQKIVATSYRRSRGIMPRSAKPKKPSGGRPLPPMTEAERKLYIKLRHAGMERNAALSEVFK